MSWVRPAASLISAVADLDRFFGMLLAGKIVSQTSLAQMQRTVPAATMPPSSAWRACRPRASPPT